MVLNELRDRLVSLSLGVYGSNLFLGSKAHIPSEDGPYISLTETGGTGPTRVHNQTGALTQRPTVQVLVRAKRYDIARAKAKEVYLALDGTYETVLSGVRYHSIVARQEPADIGLDPQNRVMISFNLEIEKQPS